MKKKGLIDKLLEEGRNQLDGALSEQKGAEIIKVSKKAFGYLLEKGAKEKFTNKKYGEGYLHCCEKDNQIYKCLTDSEVIPRFPIVHRIFSSGFLF